MPLFLEPDQSFPVVLDSDESKPKESRPTFLAKSQSMRGQKKIAEVLDRMFSDKEVTHDELMNDALDLLEDCLTGWKNMGGYEFSRQSMEIVLSYNEARALLRKILANQHVQFEEKKS